MKNQENTLKATFIIVVVVLTTICVQFQEKRKSDNVVDLLSNENTTEELTYNTIEKE